MERVFCVRCGAQFQRYDDEPWKTRCLPCFRLGKEADRQAELARMEARALAAETEAAHLRAQLRVTRDESRRLFESETTLLAEIDDLRARVVLVEGLREHLPRLRQLCHPDRHTGSKAANTASQWLNAIRAELH